MKHAALVASSLLLTASPALARDLSFSQLVKSPTNYMVFAEDGVSSPYLMACDYIPSGFSPQSPGVTISPFSSDPGARTPVRMSNQACPIFDGNGNGQADFNFTVDFLSLRDLGTHTIVCNGYSIHPGYCVSFNAPPCNVRCDERFAQPFTQPVRFFITAVNQPPTASPSHSPSSPAWNSTVTLQANSGDADGGGRVHRWSIVQRPPSSTANLSNPHSASPTLTLSSERDLGTWRFQLEVDDNEGELKTFSHQFTVPNAFPTVSITGPTQLSANQTLALAVTPTADPDGGDLVVAWNLVTSPSRATHRPASNFATGPHLGLPTTGTDVGTWVFEAVVRDNEGQSTTVRHTVEVRNLKPRIEFTGATELDVGGTLQARTTILEDDDGGALTFRWDVVQAPHSAGLVVPSQLSTGASLTRPTTASSAGTWTFRLTATDDEGESVEDLRSVLVDAPVEARVSGPSEIQLGAFPLVLNSRDSVDPDTPCPTTSGGCHDTDGRAPTLSAGIVQYTWYVIDIPPEQWGPYSTGRADEVFGVNGSGPTLTLDWDDIEPGQWTFKLEVRDAEGNVDSATHTVRVLVPSVPPIVQLTPTTRYTTTSTGVALTDIQVSGANSFDLDNTYDGPPPSAGLGITQYAWQVVPPPGCVAPAIPSTPTFTLYAAGGTVPPQCQGSWVVRLTVTDDDTPSARTSTGETSVIIGNCATGICINAPTLAAPYITASWDTTSVTVHYHIDSVLYDDPAFAYGMYPRLDILPVGGGAPIYSSVDFNVDPASRGGLLAFHWNGYSSSGTYPPTGQYTVRLTLMDGSLTPRFQSIEPSALQTETVTVAVRPSSDRLVRHQSLEDGSAQANFEYDVTGALGVDAIQWRVRNTAGHVVTSGNGPAVASGPLPWNGRAGAALQAPADFTFEVEAFRGGRSLGVSARHAFTVYRLRLRPVGGAAVPATGLLAYVNADDDNANGVSDLTEVAASENDLVELELSAEPATLSGTLQLKTPTAPAALKVWSTAAKGAEHVLPRSWSRPADALPARLFLEATRAAAAQLQLEFTPTGSAARAPETLKLNLAHVEVMQDTNDDHAVGGGDMALYTLRIGRWDNAYDGAFNLHNVADPASFVEQDPSRFYVRIHDPAANQDPAVAEVLRPQLGTLDAGGAAHDDLTELVLRETGPDTGVFLSRSQLLSSEDLEGVLAGDTDDGFAVHDGAAGVVADNAAGDRTHKANIDGKVRLAYTGTGGAGAMNRDVPLCLNARRKLDLRVVIFREPFQDIGYDHDANPGTAHTGAGNNIFNFHDANGNGVHDAGERSEPYVDLSTGGGAMRRGEVLGVANGRGQVVSHAHALSQVRRATEAWAPACIKAQLLGAIQVADAPKRGGVDILEDAQIVTDGAVDEVTPIFTALGPSMTADTVTAVFAAPIVYFATHANALALPPFAQLAGQGEKTFTVLASNLSLEYRTLAHELGHLMLNNGDSPNLQTVFYPALSTHRDNLVNRYRRITHATGTTARTVRPAGDLNAPGNSFLKPF